MIRRILAVLALAAAPFPAIAVFHLWSIEELYSNADGTVQANPPNTIIFFTDGVPTRSRIVYAPDGRGGLKPSNPSTGIAATRRPCAVR